MTESLNVVASTKPIDSGVNDPKPVATGLAEALADTYCLMFKSHAYHWNVEGPLFYSIHNLTETQYEDMFAAADVIAERIRALGKLAPMEMSDILEMTIVDQTKKNPTAGEMCDALAKDHEAIAKRLHGLIELAGEHKDPVTEDLATERSAFHEQAAWMLKAITAS